MVTKLTAPQVPSGVRDILVWMHRRPTGALAAFCFLAGCATIVCPFSLSGTVAPSTVVSANPVWGVSADERSALSTTARVRCGGGALVLDVCAPFTLFPPGMPSTLFNARAHGTAVKAAPTPTWASVPAALTADRNAFWSGKPGTWPKFRFTFKALAPLGVYVDCGSAQDQAPGISGWRRYSRFYVFVLPWWAFLAAGGVIVGCDGAWSGRRTARRRGFAVARTD